MWKKIRQALAARGLCAADANEATVRKIAGMFLAANNQSDELADADVVSFLGTLPQPQVVAGTPSPRPSTRVTSPTLVEDPEEEEEQQVVDEEEEDDEEEDPAPPQVRRPAQRPAKPGARRQTVGVDTQEILRQERTRAAEIRSRGQLLGVDEAEIEAAINSGISLGTALRRFTANLTPSHQPVQSFGGGTGLSGAPHVDGSPMDRLTQGAVEALAARALAGSSNIDSAIARHNARMMGTALPTVPQLSAAARPFRNMPLIQVASAHLSLIGHRPHLMDQTAIAEEFLKSVGPQARPFVAAEGSYNQPGMYPNLLSALANKVMDQAVEFAESTFRLWTYEIEPVADFKPTTFVALGANGELPYNRDGEPFEQSSVGEEASWISVDSYGDEFKMTPVMITGNDLQGFTDLAEDKQIAHELTGNRLCVNLLTGNVQLVDGNVFFGSSHANDITSGGGAPSAAQASSMRQLLRAQVAVGGKRRLRVGMAIAITPTTYETAGEQTFLPFNVVPVTDATINTFRGKVVPLVEPMLDDHSSVYWYGFADPRRVRTIVFAHQIGFQNGGQRTTYYDNRTKCQIFQLEGRMGAAVRNWRGGVRNSGTP